MERNESRQRFSLWEEKGKMRNQVEKVSGGSSFSTWLLLSESCACAALAQPHNYGIRLPPLLFITTSHPSSSITPFLLKGFFICLVLHLCTFHSSFSAISDKGSFCCRHNMNFNSTSHFCFLSQLTGWVGVASAEGEAGTSSTEEETGLRNTGFSHYFVAWQHSQWAETRLYPGFPLVREKRIALDHKHNCVMYTRHTMHSPTSFVINVLIN